ncbi:Tol-Pal system beta propeller repeat protein TolB [Methylophilus medardicus]|uniref:Tol-Pal system protein TolB n=1 Tax=Methylophilus medardicus TaxID=2588534 RepID=A0A5B8CVT8_9PROT|nr:Tol-Pal system protein TolB [Methylophilus medardicus]QDC50032.1 Tol-Pal system protein TolB [Methylophilus medardicus]QDC53737.1 Tol-Pal system protein TolB [Methylophilus medardicus]
MIKIEMMNTVVKHLYHAFGHVFFAIALMWVTALPARAALELEISGGSAIQIPIAILPMAESASPPSTSRLHDIISNDLRGSGMFRIINTSGMPALPTSASQIKYTDWTALKAQGLSLGEVQQAANGNIKVSVQVMDVLRQTALLQLTYTVSPSQYRHVAHLIADQIYEKFTGQPGAFATRIAYVTKVGKRFTLQIADYDGFNAQTLVSSNEPIISPAWSPDGSKMAYVSFEKKKPIVFVQSLYTGERKIVANFKGNNSAPAWSPDGNKLAVVLTYGANSQIYTISADGSNLQQITKSSAIDTEPAFSPDGSAIYFSSDRGGRPQIYKVSATGGTPTRVTFEGGYNVSPRFSPDGKYLAYIRNDGGAFKVAVQDLGTGDVKLLSTGSQDESPSFAPNARTIMYATRVGGKGTLATVTVDGLVRQRLSEAGGDIREPAWGPAQAAPK